MSFDFKKIFIEDVEPGMILAKDIVSAKGIVMLSTGTILTEQAINRIKCWGFTEVDIIENSVVETAHQRSAKLDFVEKYSEIVTKVKNAFQNIRRCRKIPLDQLMNLSEQVTDSLVKTRGVINYLHVLQLVDDYTFQHSVNVAILSGLFGRWLGINDAELKQLVFAGLLHDIGKTQIPLSILNKPGKLTKHEMEIMKGHTVQGYEILKKAGVSDTKVLNGVWSHHERLDGSGYPRSLAGDDIDETAKIIAIADIYDAMTSDRVYRRSVTPFIVVETLYSEMFEKLDPTICSVILNYLQDFFVGNIVKLNDGRQAEVVYVDKTREARPVVKTSGGEYIDLNKNRQITIVEVFN